MRVFTAKQLRRICVQITQAKGVPLVEAETVAEILVSANLRGQDGHGVLLLPRYIKRLNQGKIKPGTTIEIVHETSSTAIVNGHWGFGQVIGVQAMELAIQKAKNHAISLVGVFNCNHLGMLAHYPLMAVNQDLIGLTLCNSPPEVAPYGGRERKLGTNPLAIAIPTNQERPIILDMATAVVAAGKVRAKYAQGTQTPNGWIIDNQGRPIVDPAIFLSRQGMLLPFGGYKGFGLSLIIDILAGALTGAGNSTDLKGINGVIMSAINIEDFVPIATFKERVDTLIQSIKTTATAPGVKEILIPGDPEYNTMDQRSIRGIPIDDHTWHRLVSLAKDVDIDLVSD